MSFPRYSNYKTTGAQWLELVPAHWNLKALRHVVSRIESGTSVNARDVPAENGQIGVLKTSCVYAGTFDESENKAVVSEECDRVSCPLRENTLIVSRMNTPELVGAAGHVQIARKGLYLPDRLWQVSFEGVYTAFAHYWTMTPSYRGQVQAVCAGASSSMQNLTQDQFRSFVFPYAPLAEQRPIVAFLDRETAKIDALVEEQRRLIELLKEKRQAIISHAVTKGLDPNARMKDSGIEWLGEVPAHWEAKSLKMIIEQGTSISYGIVQPGEHADGGVPFVQTTNMSSGSFDLDLLQRTTPEIAGNYPRSQLTGGEVMLGIRASIGSAYVAPSHLAGANLSRGVARIECNSSMTSEFLVAYLSSSSVASYWALSKQGSTFSEVSIETVKELKVVVPPISEQLEICSFLEGSASQVDTLARQAELSMSLLQERRSALISAAVTGKIDVRALAPAASEAA